MLISLYRPGESFLHRSKAGVKLVCLCLFSLFVFPLSTISLLLVVLVFCLLLYACLGRGGLVELKVVYPLWPWLLAMWLFHLASGQYQVAFVVVMKMLAMVWAANLLTLTTRFSDLLDAFMVFLSPLAWLGIRTRPVALSIALMIRYIPVLSAMFQQQRQAWDARGGKAGFAQWRLVAPALIGALRIAEHAGESLVARGGVSGFCARPPKR